MHRTIISIVLGCFLTITFTSLHLAQAQGTTASARRAAIARSFVLGQGVGKKVKIELLNGTEIKGIVSRIGDNSFELVRKPGEQPLAFDYDAVARIKKAGWSNASLIALGTGIGVAAVITIVAIAVATVKIDPFPDGFRKSR